MNPLNREQVSTFLDCPKALLRACTYAQQWDLLTTLFAKPGLYVLLRRSVAQLKRRSRTKISRFRHLSQLWTDDLEMPFQGG